MAVTRTVSYKRAAGGAVLAAGLVLAAAGCGSDQEAYCDAVKDHQQELGEMVSGGGPDALLEALPTFRELADRAPEDIRDEWAILIDALQALKDALDDAGVDPATYDRDDPPAGLGDADKAAIDAAAARVGSEATNTAYNGLDQQAKDVCGTPLLL